MLAFPLYEKLKTKTQNEKPKYSRFEIKQQWKHQDSSDFNLDSLAITWEFWLQAFYAHLDPQKCQIRRRPFQLGILKRDGPPEIHKLMLRCPLLQ